MNFAGRKETDDQKHTKEFESVVKYMATDLITFSPDQDIQEAIDILLEKKISGAPVLDEHRHLVGILSEKDCLRIILESAYYDMPPESGKVSDYMSHTVTTIMADRDILEVANLFLNSTHRRFPVIDKGRVIGQISRKDILKAAKDIKATTW